MRKMKIAMASGAILFALSSCGQMEKPEDETKVGSGIEKIVESDEEPQTAQNTEAVEDYADSAERVSGEEKAGTGKEDVSEIPEGGYEYVSVGDRKNIRRI